MSWRFVISLTEDFFADWFAANADMFGRAFESHPQPHPFLPVLQHEIQYLLYFALTINLVVLSSFLVAYWKTNQRALKILIVTIINVLVIFVTPIIRAKGVIIFLSVFSFVYFMNLQASLFKWDRFEQIQFQTSKIQSPTTIDQHYQQQHIFWDIVITTFLMGVPYRATIQSISRYPTILTHLHGICIILISDTCNYLMREYIPTHFPSTSHRHQYLITLLGCLWSVSALEFAYWVMNIIGDFVGIPLAPKYLHKNPILSTSITEFWSSNWNPIISRLLQECFYLPILTLQSIPMPPAWIAVVVCFTGSGVFHAIPTIITTKSYEHGYTVFQFFFLHGIIVALENVMFTKEWLRGTKLISNNSRSNVMAATSKSMLRPVPMPCTCVMDKEQRKESDSTSWLGDSLSAYCPVCLEYRLYWDRTKCLFYLEVLFLIFVISLAYLVTAEFDWRFHVSEVMIMLLSGSISLPAIAYFHYIYSSSIKPYRIRLLGWSWVIFILFVTMPLFVDPMMAALGMFFNRSYFVGPLVRFVCKVMTAFSMT